MHPLIYIKYTFKYIRDILEKKAGKDDNFIHKAFIFKQNKSCIIRAMQYTLQDVQIIKENDYARRKI